eukprot:5397141-Amphidinium_carterae.1
MISKGTLQGKYDIGACLKGLRYGILGLRRWMRKFSQLKLVQRVSGFGWHGAAIHTSISVRRVNRVDREASTEGLIAMLRKSQVMSRSFVICMQ